MRETWGARPPPQPPTALARTKGKTFWDISNWKMDKQRDRGNVSSWRELKKSDENRSLCLDWNVSNRVFEAS